MNILITGGAGFVGCNLAHHFLKRGDQVIVLDNLSRARVSCNMHWLQDQDVSTKLSYRDVDVRDADRLTTVVEEAQADVIFHLAAQVAVTTSVADPRHDLEVNILGTFNLLESVRRLPREQRPIVVFSSTNKVYGAMEDLDVSDQGGRYAYRYFDHGIAETYPLDFHSPYGCSKGAAEQYVHDYARIYGLRTVVFRMSCVFGPRQFGTEDQGWVAHFLISAMCGRPITIYGDGKQVRDLLFINDLISAFEAAVEHIDQASREVFNIGGGPVNTLSLLELLYWLDRRHGKPVVRQFEESRPGDQLIYVSDIRKAQRILGWQPEITVPEGLDRLWEWLKNNRSLLE